MSVEGRGINYGKKRGSVMQLPQYITSEEVRRVCKEIGIRDWTRLKEPKTTAGEAKAILKIVNTGKMSIDPDEFRAGLDVELEHGTRFHDANVTNNHPILTGKIVLAHLKESLDYYKLLEVAELEGDLLKAIVKGNSRKTRRVYQKLSRAKIALCRAEAQAVDK